MITIKGKDETAILARIEKELKGEDISIFITEEDDEGNELPINEILARAAYNLNRSRIYLGRLVGNTQRQYEATEAMNETLLPISLYFTAMLEDLYPDGMLPLKIKKTLDQRRRGLQRKHAFEEKLEAEMEEVGPKALLRKQRETLERLKAEGLAPKED